MTTPTNGPAAPQQQQQPTPGLFTRITTRAWNTFADWSVEIFVSVVIVAGSGIGYWVYKYYLKW